MTSHSHIYLIVKHSVRIRGMCTESKWLYLTYWSAEMSWDLIGRAFNPLIDLIINIFFRYTITNWEKVRWLHSSLPWLFCSFTSISKTCNTRRGYSSICYSVFFAYNLSLHAITGSLTEDFRKSNLPGSVYYCFCCLLPPLYNCTVHRGCWPKYLPSFSAGTV